MEQHIREAQEREELGSLIEDQLRGEFDSLHQSIKDSIRLEVIAAAIEDSFDLYDMLLRTVYPNEPQYKGWTKDSDLAMNQYSDEEDKELNRLVKCYLEAVKEFNGDEQRELENEVGSIFLNRAVYHIEPSEEDMYEHWLEYYKD